MNQVYIHGLGQTPDSWNETISALDPGAAVLCPDLAGLVRGQDPTYQNLYRAFCAQCGGLEGPIDLCGLSLGAVLALNYAVDAPEKVRSLVLIAPQFKMPKALLRFQGLVFHFMPKSTFPQTGFGKNEFIRLNRSMLDLDFSRSLHNISCPVLIVCGEKDAANQKATAALDRMLKNSRLQIIQQAGHEVNVDAPAALAEALRLFYGQIS